MNRWLTIRRLRGPALLLLFGVTALLHQWNILSFARSWPLYLILLGVLSLMERAAFRDHAPEPVTGSYGYTSSSTTVVAQPPPVESTSPTAIPEGDRE